MCPPECSIALHYLMHVYSPVLRLSSCTISQTPGSVHIRKWPCVISVSCVFEWCMQCWCTLVGEKEGRVGVGPGSSAPDWPVTSATWSFFSNSCRQSPRASRADHQSPACQVEPSEYCTLHQTHPTTLHWCLTGVYSHAKSKDIKIKM